MNRIMLLALLLTAVRNTPASAQAEAEPNNKPQQATLITLGAAVTGYTQVADDTDCFKIRLTRGGILHIRLTPNGGPTGYFLDVVDSAQGTVGWTNASLPGGGYAMRLLAPAGTYYLIHSPYLVTASSNVPYTITTTLDTADGYEVNNTAQTASLLPEFIRLRARLDGENRLLPPLGGDQDYYRLNTVRAGILSARVHPNGTGIGFRMQLFPYLGWPVLADTTALNASTPISFERRVPLGVYYGLVGRDAGNLSSDSFYTFDFSLDTNNAPQNAVALRVCDSITASTRLSSDTDYYALPGTANGIVITASGIPAGVVLRLTAYNSSQQQIAAAQSNGGSVSMAVPTVTGSSCSLRIVEENSQGIFEQYRLKTATGGCGLAAAETHRPRSFSVFPNPVMDGTLHVDVPATEESALAELYSATGQLLLRQQLNAGSNHLNVNCSPGLYYLRTILGTGTAVDKILVR